jgi:sugar transferase (PEP-CTERM/EpsH1 system associated)
MRMLWLKTDLLVPLDKGGRLRTWHLMRHLATRHEITYLAFAGPDHGPGDVDAMRQVATRVETIPRPEPPKGSLRFLADAALHLLDPLPYAVGKYRSRRYRSRLDTLLKTERFDLIVCDFLFPAVNLPDRLPCPAVIFTHNVESEIWRRHAATSPDSLRRVLYRIQHRRMVRYEGRTLGRFDGVLAVSEADRATFLQRYAGMVRKPIEIVPTGVDADFFRPEPSSPASRRLVFTGSMDWLPNEDAMTFFARDILPLVRQAEPDVTLTIVGRAPTPTVKRLARDNGIAVTGRVDDVRPYMREAAVYVVPLRIGGGTRLKIFEAMAAGKAIVTTSVGAEGLPVVSGSHLLTADEPQTFARHIVGLFRNVDRRREIEAAARALVLDRYTWSAAGEALEESLLRVAATRSNTGSDRCPTSITRYAGVGYASTPDFHGEP